jgi:hypothetical protein
VPAESPPAFYALRGGGWRDYWTLLHPPYTAWHLSYVAIGAAAASSFDLLRLGASLLAFFLGVGVTAHALDELHGRPLQTGISDRILWALAAFGLAGAAGLGVLGAVVVSWWLVAFIAFGGFILIAYNLELGGGAFHSDAWFALSWGGFPALTGYFAQTGTLEAGAILVGGACFALSMVQRRLSTPARLLRRRATEVTGRVVLDDGSEIALDERTLRRLPESVLRALTLAVVLLALGLVLLRLG